VQAKPMTLFRIAAAFFTGMYVAQSEPNAPNIKCLILDVARSIKNSDLYKELTDDKKEPK